MPDPVVQLRSGILRALMDRDQMNIPKAGMLAFFAIGLYGIAVATAIVKVPPTQGWDDTIKAIGVGVSLVTGFFAPLSTVLLALIASFSSRELETLKARLSTGIEVDKAVITGRKNAFDALLGAAYFFYFTISKQIDGSTTADTKIQKDADQRTSEAFRFLWYLTDANQALWFKIYQLSMDLLDEIGKHPVEKRHELFNQRLTVLGAAIRKLQSAGQAALADARNEA